MLRGFNMIFCFDVFDWKALAAVSTSIGVLIALFKPFYDEKIKNQKIKSAIEYEYQLIVNRLKLFDKKSNKLPNQENFPEYSYIEGVVRGISHPIWDKYRTDLILIDNEKYQKYNDFYYNFNINFKDIFFEALYKLRESKLTQEQKKFYEDRLKLSIDIFKSIEL